jgi:hypothetical protein
VLLFFVFSGYTDSELKEAPYAKLDHTLIPELSGIIPAFRSGEYWGINDRGNLPGLYRFSEDGTVLQSVLLVGAQNNDWEAITRDASGNLYIADIGDNQKEYGIYSVYQLQEPGKKIQKTNAFYKFYFRYPEKKSFNSESFFVFRNRFYIINKENDDDDKPHLFRIDHFERDTISQAVEVGKMDLKGMVTDAHYSHSLQMLAVLTYDHLYLLETRREKDFLDEPIQKIDIDFGQCEGLAFDRDFLVITNEDGAIWRYPVNELLERNKKTGRN